MLRRGERSGDHFSSKSAEEFRDIIDSLRLVDNRWLKEEGFISLVEKVWREENVCGKASYRVAKKLIALKVAIKSWAREERVRV